MIEVPPKDKLQIDILNPNNTLVKQLSNVKEGEVVQMPPPRGGHTALLVGNSPDYILVFGGSTLEVLPGDFQVYKIKKTLNDLWVYHTASRQWS